MKTTGLICFLLGSIQLGFSQNSGKLDSTFGSNGIATVNWNDSGSMMARGVEVSSGDELFTYGYAYKNGGVRFTASKFSAQGSIVSNYGNAGTSYISLPGFQYAYAYCGHLLPDNSMLIGGDGYNGSYSFAVAKLDPNGKPDKNFGLNGFNILHVGASGADNVGYALAVGPDASILLAGSSTGTGNYDFTAVRYTQFGKIDSSFGNNGVAVIPIGKGSDNCYTAAVQPDGKSLLAGDIQDSISYRFAVLRLQKNGKPDSSFGKNGIAIYSVDNPEDDYGYCIRVLPDKSILFGGTAKFNGNYNYTILKIKENGILDSSFGTNGIFHFPFGTGSADYGQTFIVHPVTGHIVFTGRTFVAGSSLGVMVIKPNGSIDSAFNGTGKTYVKLAVAQHYSYGIGIQSSGKIVASAYANSGYPNKAQLVRFKSHLSMINKSNYPEKTSIRFYPNPAQDKIYFTAAGAKMESIRIYDLSGKLLIQKNGFDDTEGLAIDSLKNGNYIAQLIFADGSVKTEMLLKN